jgi:DNA-binding NtrC family response regulator
MSPEILVVSNDDVSLVATLQVLNEAGYNASGASTFEEGKRLMAARCPDFVIADERLGNYNGLHLILRGRFDDPDMGGIVTSVAKDPGLEAEARRLNVECVVKPEDPADLLAPISRTLQTSYDWCRRVS